VDLSDEILAALGCLVLRYDDAAHFAVKGVPPEWVRQHAPLLLRQADVHVLTLIELFPALETALADLGSLWINTRDRSKELGEWVESDVEGKELHLKASLLTIHDIRLLMLSSVDEQTIDVIRRARASILKKR